MCNFRRLAVLAGSLGWMLMLWDSSSCHAQARSTATSTDLATTALAIAPPDAAFFGTSLNMRNSWEQFIQGDFVTSLRRVPYVQRLEREIADQWQSPQGPAAQLRSTLENPNVRNLLRLGGDMLSQEFFIYGEDNWCDTIEGMVNFQTEMLSAIQENPEALGTFFEQLDREDIANIRIPTTVLGFRLSDDSNARTQLDQLEGLLRIAGGQQAELKPFLERLQRRDFKDGQSLTLTFDASMIPLDRIEDEEQRQAAERAVELLEGRSISLTLAVKANVLLMAVGEQDDLLAGIGTSTTNLLDHPALDVLKKADLQDLRAVSFASQRWRESQWEANFGNYFRNLSLQFSVALERGEDEIPDVDQWREEIAEDAQWIDNKIGEIAPEFGDLLTWSRRIPSGLEGWSYDWSEQRLLENGNPLQVLQHAGNSPLVMFAWKQAMVPEWGELWDYVLARIPDHARRFIRSAEQTEEDRESALEVFERGWPLFEQAVQICREQISPALADRETLFTLAAGWTTSELGSSLPPSAEPLTLPELAIACPLADRDQFLAGCQDLYDVFDAAVELVRDVNPDSVPADYRVPRPREETVGEATSYYYQELSDAVKLPGFKPQLLVTESAIVIGYSDSQVREMMTAKPLTKRPAWLTEETPTAAVSYLDYAGLLAAMRPWLHYGISLSGKPLDEPLLEAPLPVPSGGDLLQIWDCFSTAGVATGTLTIDDDGPDVSRWVWVSR